MARSAAAVPLVSLFLALVDGAPARAQPLSGEMVFVAVQPCRIVDTRPNQPLLAGVARTFHVVGSGNFAPQGGPPAGCGIPGYIAGAPVAKAVMFNFVAVGPLGPGNLRAWPGGAPPTAS